MIIAEEASAKSEIYAYEGVFLNGELILRPSTELTSILDIKAKSGLTQSIEEFSKKISQAKGDVPSFVIDDLVQNLIEKPSFEYFLETNQDPINFVENEIKLWEENGFTINVNDSEKDVIFISESAIVGLSRARMREITRQISEELFTEAASAACLSRPRPQEISPSVSVSFNLFGGIEFRVSAKYIVTDLCKEIDIN